MQRSNKWFIVASCLLLLTGVQLGALGTHALNDILTPQKLKAWELAVQYQLLHSLGLIVICMLHEKLGHSALIRGSAWLMLAGTCMFSGMIYATAMGAPPALGIVTPLGGATLMLAWLTLAVAVFRA
jgi:uncharacterized membrane protein YgdD (TMEM256/DUF423 family)